MTVGSGTTAAAKLAAVTSVPEPPNVNYRVQPQCWNYKNGQPYETFKFGDRMTDLRVDLSIERASTVEVDLEDQDFTVLSQPLFAHWAFQIEDVAVDSQRQFQTTRLTNSTDNAYLGDEADLEWVLGQRPIDFELGEVYFRLCSIQSSQAVVTLQFEDRCASKLRAKSGAKSWDRSQHTRAQFVAMLCREAGVDYFIPELNVEQPVEIDTDSTGGTTTTVVTGHTISSAANLTVKGSPITKSQLSVANQICQIGEKLHAPSDAIVAVLFDCIYESGMGVLLSNPTSNYGGVLGGSKSIFAPSLASAQDMITAAYQGGSGFNSAISLASTYPGQIAVIGSHCTAPVPYNSSGISEQYEAENAPGGIAGTVAEAQAIYAAYGGPASTGSTRSSSTSSGSYAFTRGANEDSWDCIQRLASEVAWYAFARQNRLWFVSGNYLFQQRSQLTCEAKKNGVAWIDVDLDMGARDGIAECDIYAETKLWTALPGMVVAVKNRGPATGKWYVDAVELTPLNETQLTQITTYKPVPKRAEPAAGADDSSSPTPPGGVLSGGLGTPSAAFQASKELAAKKLIYTKGARILKPLNAIPQGETLYDCSASSSEVLLLAGFPLPDNATYGDPAPTTASDWSSVMNVGPGRQMTVWIDPASHMFIELNVPGLGHMQGNTVNPNGPGFGFFSWTASGCGSYGGPNPGPNFTPYHYPGT